MLLCDDEPAPFEVHDPEGGSSFVVICDHAGRRLPRSLGSLGLAEEALSRHIAWDIGALGVARVLAQVLEGCLVAQRYSRLVIDCNRAPTAADSIVSSSEGIAIPGNQGIDPTAAAARAKEIFAPYHAEIRRIVDQRIGRGRPTVLVSVHSFTPIFLGVARPWHVGVLHGRDVRVAAPLLRSLREELDLVVGDNQPYAGDDLTDYSILHHGEQRGIPHVEVEIRQDLLLDEAMQNAWGRRLASHLSRVAHALE